MAIGRPEWRRVVGHRLMKNLTPEHLRCDIGASCPAVYELEDGRLLIRGIATTDVVDCGPDEASVIIDRALLANVLSK